MAVGDEVDRGTTFASGVTAQQTSRQHDDGPQQREHTFHRDSYQPERQRDQPDDRVKDERQLRLGGVITDDTVEEDARVRLYRLQPETFATLRGWLDEVESFWGGQLQFFKAHAEAKAGRRRK